MNTIIKIELYKIFRKWRSYIGFILIGVLVPIIQIVMMLMGDTYLNAMTQSLQQSFIFVGNLVNGYFIAYLVFGSLYIHIPFLIALVTGDLLAGEATSGTYRLLITRPVSRIKLVTSKYFAGVIYSSLLIVWLALVSLGLGIILLGSGDLIVIKRSVIVFSKSDVLWRFLLAYGYAALSMSVVASLAFLFSSMVENAIGPIIATMAVIIGFIILSAINIEFFQSMRPYLFTTYMGGWQEFFDDPIDYKEIIKSVLILLAYMFFLFGLTAYIFRKKDILS